MRDSKIEIGAIRVRCSGLSKEQGKQLARLVAERIAQTKIPANGTRRIDALHLRVSGKAKASVGRIADEIATQFKRGLR